MYKFNHFEIFFIIYTDFLNPLKHSLEQLFAKTADRIVLTINLKLHSCIFIIYDLSKV